MQCYLVLCCENGVPIYDNRDILTKCGIDLSMMSDELSGASEIQEVQQTFSDDAKIYNLQGLEVTSPRKGQIYIRSGKKIIL